MKKQLPFWIFATAALVALILPTLLQDGMFMDGLLYSSVAKNLADGIGTFWFPHFSKTMYPFFDQQPPLGFGIQALFFKVLGSSIYVERFYCFLCALITAALIGFLWRMVFKNEDGIKHSGWLPVFFWITIPVCFWAYSNGVMENTMSIFDLLAVICIVLFFQKGTFSFILLAGTFIFLASLTKGIQGMFPLVGFFAGWVAYRNVSFMKMLGYSLLLLAVPGTIYFLLLQNDSVFQSLSTYLQHRVLNSIENVVGVENRFYLIYRLFLELIPMMAISIIVVLLSRRKNETSALHFKRHVIFFLLIGIAGSFPLMVTLEQRGFYLVNSFPYFAMAMAAICAPYLSAQIERINLHGSSFKIFRVITLLLLAGTLCFSVMQIGKASRDKDTIHDIHLIGSVVPRGEILGGVYELWSQWSVQEYLIRHYYISLDNKITNENDYVILEPGTAVPDSVKVEKINIPTIRYHLFKVQK